MKQEKMDRERELKQEKIKLEAELKQERMDREREFERLQDEMQRIKLVSSTQAKEEEYKKSIKWELSEIEGWLKEVEMKVFEVEPLKKCDRESPLQNWWTIALQANFPTVMDTHRECHLIGRDGAQHKPDLTMVVDGTTIVWERVDRMLELKPSILNPAEKRDAVIQVYSRLIEVFDHQPNRTVAYGAALDHANLCFVRVDRKFGSPTIRTLYVSDCLNLFDGNSWSRDGQLFLRFLSLSARDCGFVDVVLPEILGVQMESVLCRHKDAVLYMADRVVYKVTKNATEEISFMKRLEGCQPVVCPKLLKQSDNAFSMQMGIDARNVERLDLNSLIRDLFWVIYQMHEASVIHCDIKPSNVLLLDDAFCLIDFDAAVLLSPDVERFRYTEAFASSDLLIEKEARDWDLVGLFWTVTYFVAQSQTGSKWQTSQWTTETRLRWGLKMIVDEGSVLRRTGVVPESSGTYQCQLMHPKQVMSVYGSLKREGDSEYCWIERVRKLEKEKNWPFCPNSILKQEWQKR